MLNMQSSILGDEPLTQQQVEVYLKGVEDVGPSSENRTNISLLTIDASNDLVFEKTEAKKPISTRSTVDQQL